MAAEHSTWRDVTVQAKDLGGLGSASGGRPRNGGMLQITKSAETWKGGKKQASGASAAPQQDIPAAPQQQ
jgi:hypothetical protein